MILNDPVWVGHSVVPTATDSVSPGAPFWKMYSLRATRSTSSLIAGSAAGTWGTVTTAPFWVDVAPVVALSPPSSSIGRTQAASASAASKRIGDLLCIGSLPFRSIVGCLAIEARAVRCRREVVPTDRLADHLAPPVDPTHRSHRRHRRRLRPAGARRSAAGSGRRLCHRRVGTDRCQHRRGAPWWVVDGGRRLDRRLRRQPDHW